VSGAGTTPPGDLDARELRRRLDSGEPVALLDVREPSERALCAIPAGAGVPDLHVPMAQVPGRLDAIREAAGRSPLVVYCHHGVRSRMAALWLAAQGVAGVLNLAGGIDAWSVEADPTTPRY
jgi:rhodanese-related sulfurtransferase